MGHLRIIAGRLKGRRIEVPERSRVRPTGDRVREALFGILGPRVAGARVLDAYSGSGALGFEALSRGAREVVFIELDRKTARDLELTAFRLHVDSSVKILQGEASRVMAEGFLGGEFDLILVDPSYDDPHAAGFLRPAGARLAEDGVLVLEREYRGQPFESEGLERFRSERYGRSRLDFYRRHAESRPNPAG